MDKKINNNGFDYVDLGLPSGTKWAAKNIGASKPTDYGLYFQWGDTKGYTKEQLGMDEGKKPFRWFDYNFSYQGSSIALPKYRKPGETLELEDDAAHANMGGDWHMPTPKQAQELLDNTKRFWTTQDGINGMAFISKNDTSKFIFIPATGYFGFGLVLNDDVACFIWLSNTDDEYFNHGQDLYLSVDKAQLSSYFRFYGFPIRGVIG